MSALPIAVPSVANVWAAGILWIPACIATVALRFYARKYRNAPILLDDWLTIPAAALLIGMCAALIYGVAIKAIGYPTPVPPPGQDPLTFQDYRITVVKQLVYAISLQQHVSLCCSKLSCLLFYRRVFNVSRHSKFDLITRVAIGLVIGWGIVFLFAIIFWCRLHFAAWWTNIRDISRYCPDALNIELSWAITDCITDIMIIVIPISPLLKLKMSTIRKIAVMAVFGMGLLCTAASAVRFVIYLKAVLGLKQEYKSSGANNTTVTLGLYWNIMEVGLTLIGICLPTVYGLVSNVVKPSYHGGYASSGGSGLYQMKQSRSQFQSSSSTGRKTHETNETTGTHMGSTLSLQMIKSPHV